MADLEGSDEDSRPRVVQGSAAPVFRCSADGVFRCIACEHVLVEGYQPRQLLAIDIQCWRCREVSRTANWPDDEPLPQQLVTIGRAGAFLIGSTVDMAAGGAAFACDQEIARVRKRSGIQPAVDSDFNLSPDGLARLQARLALLCHGFDVCLARTQNAFARGNLLLLKFPPAWALLQLQRSVASGKVDLSGADGVAVTFIQATLGVLSRWQHVERFAAIQAALLYEFSHTISQMIAASYLADVGNGIGFTAPLKDGGRSPDLFVNLDAVIRHALEVKAPNELQWPQALPSEDRLRRVIEAKLKESRGQIAQLGGGILVLGASIADERFSEMSEAAVRGLTESGRVPSRVSAIAVVNLAPNAKLSAAGNNLELSTEARIFAVANPRYAGPGHVAVG